MSGNIESNNTDKVSKDAKVIVATIFICTLILLGFMYLFTHPLDVRVINPMNITNCSCCDCSCCCGISDVRKMYQIVNSETGAIVPWDGVTGGTITEWLLDNQGNYIAGTNTTLTNLPSNVNAKHIWQDILESFGPATLVYQADVWYNGVHIVQSGTDDDVALCFTPRIVNNLTYTPPPPPTQ